MAIAPTFEPETHDVSAYEQALAMDASCIQAISDLAAATRGGDAWSAIHNQTIPELFGTLMRLRALAEGAALGLALQAHDRGLVTESPHPSLTEWIRAAADAGGAPVTAAVAAGFRRVSELARRRTPDLSPLIAAATTGRVPVATAAKLGHDLTLIANTVPQDIAETAIEAMIDCAARGDSRQDLAIARQGVIATYGRRPSTDGPDDPGDNDASDNNGGDNDAAPGPSPFEAEQAQLHVRRTLTSWRMAEDGLWERLWRTTNEGKAVADAALNALAAPHPPGCCPHGCGEENHTRPQHSDGNVDGVDGGGSSFGRALGADEVPERDLRTPGQRLHDALLDLCRVVATDPNLVHGEHARPGTAAKAQIIITMPEGDLRARTGYGTDGFGTIIPPEAVRRFACDAAVIPAVLGSDGAVLDLGRTARTASPAQLTALRLRDGGCTFPSCRAPASWCEAHHLIHWIDGGPTNLDNLALLCGAHHTHIHHRHWTGRLDPATGHVAWRPPDPG